MQVSVPICSLPLIKQTHRLDQMQNFKVWSGRDFYKESYNRDIISIIIIQLYSVGCIELFFSYKKYIV